SHGVRAHKERRVASGFQWSDITRPGIAKHIFSAAFQAFRNQAFEAPAAPCAVAIDHNDLRRASGLRATNGSIDFARKEPPSLLIERRPAHHLFPDFNSGHALHITPDHHAHSLVPSFLNHSSFLIRLPRLRYVPLEYAPRARGQSAEYD